MIHDYKRNSTLTDEITGLNIQCHLHRSRAERNRKAMIGQRVALTVPDDI